MEKIAVEEFTRVFGSEIELSSAALGGHVVSVSDEFFAEAFHLLKVEPSQSLKGQFGPNGALYDGWETRRHNPRHDWCIIKLGASGFVHGFDIDTSHFNGNEAPATSVAALYDEGSEPSADDARWTTLLERVELGPNSRHLFKIESSKSAFNYLKLSIFPDGGVARFRAYGLVQPTFVKNPAETIDLTDVHAGGRIVYVSDQHFGVGSNLLLPGRGKDMGDGWETKRSRTKDHKDWVIAKLGHPGYLEHVEIDTAHFIGNYPESCELHGTRSGETIPTGLEEKWTLILPRTKLGPNRKHFLQLESDQKHAYTHVRMTIYPDGGVKRLRIHGKLALENSHYNLDTKQTETVKERSSTVDVPESAHSALPEILYATALPLTPEAFLPFGQVIQAWGNTNYSPRGIQTTSANAGSAVKFHKLAKLHSSYPMRSGETAGISVYRCQPATIPEGRMWEARVLERHPHTSQAFIPFGSGLSEDSIESPGDRYLVVVARNGEADDPDISTVKAFIARADQGIMYNTAVWHQPMVALDKPMDFACIETQIGDSSVADCELYDIPMEKKLLIYVK